MTASTNGLRLSVAWFETALPPAGQPALGDPETVTWDNLAGIIAGSRREGDKDGCCIVPSRFEAQPKYGRQVRRQLANVLARSAVMLDIEAGQDGEPPPLPAVSATRLEALELGGLVYTSTHTTRSTTSGTASCCRCNRRCRPMLPSPP
jgi:hypothetical protein